MNKIKLIVLLFVLCSFGCTKKETTLRLPNLDTPIVKGIELRDPAGNPMGTLGKPNVQTDAMFSNRKVDMFIHPNPCERSLRISFFNEEAIPGSDHKIWITPAQSGSKEIRAVFPATHSLVAGGAPVTQAEFNASQGSARINTEQLQTGFYRVYVKLNDKILYDNLYVLNEN